MLNELGTLVGWLVGMPLAGGVVVLAGHSVGNLMDDPKVPRWQIYIMLFVLGVVATHLPEFTGR